MRLALHVLPAVLEAWEGDAALVLVLGSSAHDRHGISLDLHTALAPKS